MKKIIFPILALSLIAGSFSCQKNIDEVANLLTQYSQEWSEAIINGDASNVVDYFSSDMIYQNASGERLSKDEIIRDINENPNKISSYELKDLKVQLIGQSLASVTGGFNNTWIDENGNEQINESRFTNVWQKKSGKWQCIIGHGNPLQFNNQEEDLAKIKAIPTMASEAINSNNFQAWLNLFDENAQVMFTGQETSSGREKMQKELEGFWVDMESDYTFEHSETKICGNFAYYIGLVNGTEKNLKTSEITKINSREMVIYKKQDNGEWKIFRLLVNDNMN